MKKIMIIAIIILLAVVLIFFAQPFELFLWERTEDVPDNHVVKESFESSNFGNYGFIYQQVGRGQTFTPTDSYDIYGIRVLLKEMEYPEGEVTIGICNTQDGVPTGNWLTTARRDTVSIRGPGWKWISFDPVVSVEKDVVYAIVINCEAEYNNQGVNWGWNDNNGYTLGQAVIQYAGEDWSIHPNENLDYGFEIYTYQEPTDEDTPTDDDGSAETPGFEMLTFILALFVAVIILRKRIIWRKK